MNKAKASLLGLIGLALAGGATAAAGIGPFAQASGGANTGSAKSVDRPVEIWLEVGETDVRVSVHDEGPGVPAAEQQRIWERFERAEGVEPQSRTAGGLGLGLYISRTIIEQHRGEVGLESAPGQGATFWCTFPLARASEEAGGAASGQIGG